MQVKHVTRIYNHNCVFHNESYHLSSFIRRKSSLFPQPARGYSSSSATLFISSSTVSLSTFLAFQHADWTRACESSRYPGGPPTGPSVAGKVSSFVLQRDGWATVTNIVVDYLGAGEGGLVIFRSCEGRSVFAKRRKKTRIILIIFCALRLL